MADIGEGPGEASPPLPPLLFLDQTDARREEKNFFEAGHPPISGSGWPSPPPPPYLTLTGRDN